MTSTRPKQVPPQAHETPSSEISSGAANPLEPATRAVTGVRGGANRYGGFSIEAFCDQGGLSYTHEDAQGWLSYVNQFTPINFWYKDAGVKIWAYYEQYDNWMDTYGMDAVVAVYHSGHGGMDGNGVFYVPMGAAWAGNDCTATSNNMRLGNEHARYIFWSTCLSCRVLDGQNPIRTWSPANLGFRMLFGFETVSWDSPDYGKNFWQKWNGNGLRLGTAWLDASWAIAHDQAPSVVACGASAAEAQDRVFNEQYLYGSPVSHDWWWWRWYYAASAAREPERALPKNLLVARLAPVGARAASARALADRFQLDMKLSGDVPVAADRSFRVAEGDMLISYGADDAIEVQLKKPNLSNRNQIATAQAYSVAQDAVRRYGLDEQTALTLDRVRFSREGGGTASGSGQIEGPYTTETVVQFRQMINGLPVITPDAGAVRVAVDNDGSVTRVHSSVRAVDQLTDRPRITAPSPQPNGTPAATADGTNYEAGLAAEFSRRLASWAISGKMPVGFATVPGSTEIGYDVRGDAAALIARRAVEVDFGNGYRKRYWVTSSLFE